MTVIPTATETNEEGRGLPVEPVAPPKGNASPKGSASPKGNASPKGDLAASASDAKDDLANVGQKQLPLPAPPWSIESSKELYGVNRWGAGCFDINEEGNVAFEAPTENGIQTVSLMDVIAGLHQRDLNMPVMLRIENLIEDRVRALNTSFRNAIEKANYQGGFRAVFPIKVNQQHHVVDSISRSGKIYGHGLEAGSKAELLVAMTSVPTVESLIVCNGYKDEEFVDLGLQACRLGYKCFFVLETQEELELIIKRSRHYNVKPCIGARVKLATKVEGHWAGDSGDRSLFGLTTVELITAIDTLKEAGMIDCFQMLHFHLGSQITNIRNIRDGLKEACRFYIGLIEDGAPMGYLDLGGGLAVDYTGTASTEAHSRNYDLGEYSFDVIETVMNSLDAHNVPHPTLVTESGRWTVAPMSVLMFNVLAVTNFDPEPLPDALPTDASESVVNLMETLNNIQLRRLQENYNDAVYYRDQVRDSFRAGAITLRERALGENIYLAIVNKINSMLPQLRRVPAELESLSHSLSDIYYGNFSVFQSLPDAWAIEQVFPVMPLHRLDEQPTRKAIIADLTCDCDGKLDRFSGADGEVVRTIDLHEIEKAERYYVGVFLVGAYQETLGDLHNLFGDNNVASIRVASDGSVEFVEEVPGDTIADVLSYVEYDPQTVLSRFRAMAEEAVREKRITVEARQEMVSLFRDSLQGFTYFKE